MAETINDKAASIDAAPEPVAVEPEGPAAPGPDWVTIITAPTGAGAVEDYQQHVLNPAGSHAWARVLRGVTGLARVLFGMESLNVWWLDLIGGALEWVKAKPAA